MSVLRSLVFGATWLLLMHSASATIIASSSTADGWIDTGRGEMDTTGITLDTIYYPAYGYNRRTFMEFDIASLAGNTINAATLSLQVHSFSTDYRAPTVRLSGYAGDGVISYADGSASTTFLQDRTLCLGATGCTSTTLYTFDVTGYLQSLLAGSATYSGFMLSALSTMSVSWISSDYPNYGYYYGPSLSVDFTEPAPPVLKELVPAKVPEPSSIVLISLGLAGLGFARRKNAA